MRPHQFLCLPLWSGVAFAGSVFTSSAMAQSVDTLQVVYPPAHHLTSAQQIFLIGTAPAQDVVEINGQVIKRSASGHFAPSFPLQLGENIFTVQSQTQTLQIQVMRSPLTPPLASHVAVAEDSLTPALDLARLPGERVCFGAIAQPDATVTVNLGRVRLPLQAQPAGVHLPPNAAVLTHQNEPEVIASITQFLGCGTLEQPGILGNPEFTVNWRGQTFTLMGPGTITVLQPQDLTVIEVTATAGVARTGPSTNYSRLTPLPKGVQATVTGREGDWLRLDYGAWIKASETRVLPGRVLERSLIRSITSRQQAKATEIIFPLQYPVPVSVEQSDGTFTLVIHNVTAQTDTIYLDDGPLIRRLDWQPIAPGKIAYHFRLKSPQHWGYDLRYQGSSLILTLRHPPHVSSRQNAPLDQVTVLLDPGHGGAELGSRGPTGYPEKAANLRVSKRLKIALEQFGATVLMTREDDRAVSLAERVEQINDRQPTVALSIHYNALPDNGDAENTAGIGAFWFHPQAHSLATFLHHYLVKTLDRPPYGVYWNNLALTRPHIAPAVLLELGFMINPQEFEWITDERSQQQLAEAIAAGFVQWLQQQ